MRTHKESENISQYDSEVYINHLDNLREDFKIHFGILDDMDVPDFLLTPFDMKIDNKCYESDIEGILNEMHVDLEAKRMIKGEDLSEHWSNINTATTYPKLTAVAEPFLPVFPTSYMVEVSHSHVSTN